MPPIVQILGLPFLGCLLMSAILGNFGTHVLKREVIFIDIALAQIAAVGAIAAHMLFEVHGDSFTAYLCAVGCVVLAACFYSFARSRITQISLEAVIGISYAIAAAGALFLVGIAPGGHMHIQHILSGSLLWTGWEQILICFVTFSVIGICLYLIRNPITRISEHYRNGTAGGFGFIAWDFIFYVLLGIVITVSVQIAGVIVVFAYLIIPATVAAAVTGRRPLQMAIIWAAAVAASLCGLLFAYYLDFSVGPSIALFLGIELVAVSIIVCFLKYFSLMNV